MYSNFKGLEYVHQQLIDCCRAVTETWSCILFLNVLPLYDGKLFVLGYDAGGNGCDGIWGCSSCEESVFCNGLPEQCSLAFGQVPNPCLRNSKERRWERTWNLDVLTVVVETFLEARYEHRDLLCLTSSLSSTRQLPLQLSMLSLFSSASHPCYVSLFSCCS